MHPIKSAHTFSALVATMILTCLLGCSASTQRLDEADIYTSPQLRLKIVRYFEDLPLHYTGETSVLLCASKNTKDRPSGQMHDAGWADVGGHGAIGSKSAQELVAKYKSDHIAIKDEIVVIMDGNFQVSFDACGSFAFWDPDSLPSNLMDPDCAPKGKKDCSWVYVNGVGGPDYEDIAASAKGEIAFTVRSKAFVDGKIIRVRSTDFGKTWSIEPRIDSDKTKHADPHLINPL